MNLFFVYFSLSECVSFIRILYVARKGSLVSSDFGFLFDTQVVSTSPIPAHAINEIF